MVNEYISKNPPSEMTLEDIVQAIAPNSLTKLPKTLATKCRKSLEDDPPLRVVLYRIQTEPKPKTAGKTGKTRTKSVSFVSIKKILCIFLILFYDFLLFIGNQG